MQDHWTGEPTAVPRIAGKPLLLIPPGARTPARLPRGVTRTGPASRRAQERAFMGDRFWGTGLGFPKKRPATSECYPSLDGGTFKRPSGWQLGDECSESEADCQGRYPRQGLARSLISASTSLASFTSSAIS